MNNKKNKKRLITYGGLALLLIIAIIIYIKINAPEEEKKLEGDSIKTPQLEMFDRWLLTKLSNVIKECTETFGNYEYIVTKLKTENLFWKTFCDHYLEIIKDRLYNEDKRGKTAKESAQYTLYTSLLSILK